MVESSEQFGELAVALAKFHADCPVVLKDSINSQLRSKYADLGTILREINPVLAKHGLSVLQFPAGELQLVTMLLHSSGQFFKSVSVLRPQDAVVRRGQTTSEDVRAITPQAYGSALTYQRRYALAALLSLCIDEDDDGARSQRDAQDKANPTYRPTEVVPPDAFDKKEPSEPKKVEKLTEEKIADIQSKILTAEIGQLPKMEQALSQYGVSGALDKADWGYLAGFLLNRWIDVSPVKDFGAISNKIVGYRSKGLLESEQQDYLTGLMTDRLNAQKPEGT